MNMSSMPASEGKNKKFGLKIVLLLVVLGIGYWAISKFNYARHHEETDDAQIDADIAPVLARVGGYVKEIRFEENQPVQAGDTLVIIDDRDLAIKVKQAEAAVENMRANADVAMAGVETAKANLRTAESSIESANVRLWRADQEYMRITNLQKNGAGTAQQFDAAKAEKDAAAAQLATASRQREASAAMVTAAQEQVKVANTNIVSREADLEYARQQHDYTVVIAPSTGVASKKGVQIGQLVNAGSPLFSVVAGSNAFVIANFKETQLDKIRKGQTVEVTVDAFPEHAFIGTVYSFSPATGAKFSLLPPDNATGNYVKVVQRVPVKILLNSDSSSTTLLRPGMSVHVSVQIDS